MPVLAMAIPIPPGKTTALEHHISEAVEREDFNETLESSGILQESWHIQETPQGDLLLQVFQCDDPEAMLQEFGASKKPLHIWQKQFIKETLGIDLSQPPPGPPPRTIFEWP